MSANGLDSILANFETREILTLYGLGGEVLPYPTVEATKTAKSVE